MKRMADLDAVHLGLDENEADIAEELQHFDDPFNSDSDDTEKASSDESLDSEPSFSSMESLHSVNSKNKIVYKTNAVITKSKANKIAKKTTNKKSEKSNNKNLKTAIKEQQKQQQQQFVINGKNSNKKKQQRLGSGSKMKNCLNQDNKSGRVQVDVTANTAQVSSNSEGTAATVTGHMTSSALTITASDAESKKLLDTIELKKANKNKIKFNINQGSNQTINNNNKICKKNEIICEEQHASRSESESESESENSDMTATIIKRNGRKSESITSNLNEKKLAISGATTGSVGTLGNLSSIATTATIGVGPAVAISSSSSLLTSTSINMTAASFDAIASAASTVTSSATTSSSAASATATTTGTQHTTSNTNVHGAKPTSSNVGSGTGLGNSGTGGTKNASMYDFKTKLNYLFRDTRFFLIKSNNADNVILAKNQNVWATLPQNDMNLNQAFKEARNILLIFSVNESGKFLTFFRSLNVG